MIFRPYKKFLPLDITFYAAFMLLAQSCLWSQLQVRYGLLVLHPGHTVREQTVAGYMGWEGEWSWTCSFLVNFKKLNKIKNYIDMYKFHPLKYLSINMSSPYPSKWMSRLNIWQNSKIYNKCHINCKLQLPLPPSFFQWIFL